MDGLNGSRYNVEFSAFGGQNLKAISRKDLGERGNRVFMDRGFETTLPQLKSPTHPHGVVYLDGACLGPHIDSKNRIYSLDHHSECIRLITLATCMQALLLTRRRVIDSLGHKIMGNDPDADTRFAAWALLNADAMAYDEQAFRRILPLFQLEGNIDGLGFGSEDLTGLTTDQIGETRNRLHWLMNDEQELKTAGRWSTIDFIDFTENSFRKLDKYAFYRSSPDYKILKDIHNKEILPNGQTVDYVRVENAGIYEVERDLMSEGNPACIIFHDGRSKWTVKLTGLVSPFSLTPVWNALNETENLEKSKQGVADERLIKIGWGGADGIGGAPRYYNGHGPFIDNSRILEIIFRELSAQAEGLE